MVNFEGFNFVSVDGLGSASDCRGVLINNNTVRGNTLSWVLMFFFL